MDIERKVVIVTGAAMGTGRVIALRLGAEGARVMVADIDRSAGQGTVDLIRSAGGEADLVPVDMTRRDAVGAMIEAAEAAFGGLDALVNNAGGAEDPPFPDTNADDLDRCLDLNLRAPLHAIQRALPVMRQRGSGAIVNIASVGGVTGGPHNFPAYNAAKAGLIRLTESLESLHQRYGVRVSVVVPGLILTDRVRAGLMALTPAKRQAAEEGAVLPEDVAAAVVDLVRDESCAGRVVPLGR